MPLFFFKEQYSANTPNVLLLFRVVYVFKNSFPEMKQVPNIIIKFSNHSATVRSDKTTNFFNKCVSLLIKAIRNIL